jgi:hypothetical protein
MLIINNMSVKDLFFDFLNFIFLIVLVAFVIFYFIAGDRFVAFMKVMQSLIPIAIFAIAFLIALKIKRREYKKNKERDGEGGGINLFLSHFDILKWDIIIFLTPLMILLLSLLVDKAVDLTDIFQAVFSLIIMYFWKKSLLKKIN